MTRFLVERFNNPKLLKNYIGISIYIYFFFIHNLNNILILYNIIQSKFNLNLKLRHCV